MTDDFQGWERRDKPPTLFRRFAFAQYAQTRAFLDALSALSEEVQRHPQNINFGTTYVNVTIGAADGDVLSTEDERFAERIAALAGRGE
ncbi:MAG: 4a-hydroxytetrahydrobiopterin dehydratase [Burkholderiales bacterium]|jgi:pterin-4a-carbinolamine dehydratase|uniref:4a-hydroxytetrahydrobiopterin dehydratase n=1 Tax=unclassified Nitrobacter TaxID=2620411 RepID=UPI0009276A1E|nr:MULTISPECIES: 4a-hydroxytetrahydrobiopterin dehydratase [unclassified Nitrobacter]MBN9407339.1 4a-hydroxytetrahydrobiopterin dehydratase [Burkholderiales bacterium]OJV02563.1 MAG: pterin dehydratase [Nitrobacter sp. 62-23]